MTFYKLILIVLCLNYAYSLRFEGDISKFPQGWKTNTISNPQLLSIGLDPLDSNVKVFNISHPKNSCSSFCGITGGAIFNVKPFPNFFGNVSTFEFSVFFHETFNFVKGGKLLGVQGGILGGKNGCSGCNNNITSRSDCFSARFMWGKEGNGYPYLYLPLNVNHEPDFCNLSYPKTCVAECGLEFNQTKYFEKGKWTHIKQNIRLNTPGKNDGLLQVWVNGIKMVYYNKMNYRTKYNVGITEFTIGPFFGGSADSYKTPVDTFTLYKDIIFTDY